MFEAIFRGERVALKLCDLWQHLEYQEEMFTEVCTYLALKDLQGVMIPQLKGAGYTPGGLFVLATQIAGSPIEVQKLSDQERGQVLRILSEIHGRGICHGA